MLATNTNTGVRLTFGLFEVDLASGELWKAGFRVKLQMQPFKVLTILLEHAGEVVSREEIQKRVWGPEVTVDFEQSLGGAVKKVREALGDSADNPIFIETLARRGYRFIAPVGELESPGPLQLHRPMAQPAAVTPSSSPAHAMVLEPPSPVLETAAVPRAESLRVEAPVSTTSPAYMVASVSWRSWPLSVGFLLGMVVMAGLFVWFRRLHPQIMTLPRIVQVTQMGGVYTAADGMLETLPGSATDGVRLFTSALENGNTVLKQISVATGESRTLPVPEEVASPVISDLSADGTKLLVRSHPDASIEQPLWVVPVDGGSALRVFELKVIDAAWMRFSNEIVYSTADSLWTVSLDTGQRQKLTSLPGRALWLRWSPDGHLLRFTMIDPGTHRQSLWELTLTDPTPRPVTLRGLAQMNVCCGVWTDDGRRYVFQTTQSGHSDLWEIDQTQGEPFALTNGPLSYESPASHADDVFFFGNELRTQLQAFSAGRALVPVEPFLARADRVTYSRDHRWVMWTQAGGLWRAHADGTDLVRLTPASLRVFLGTFSPDASRIGIMARTPGKGWKVYAITAADGDLQLVSGSESDVGDPSFSADGNLLVYGRVPDAMGQQRTPRPLTIFDLRTGRTSAVPNSSGYFSPRWSPDGRYIAALTLDQRCMVLYDVAAKTWKQIAGNSAADPVWSSDSRNIFIYSYRAASQPIASISVPDGESRDVLSLKHFALGNRIQFSFAGLNEKDEPLIQSEASDGNVYMIHH